MIFHSREQEQPAEVSQQDDSRALDLTDYYLMIAWPGTLWQRASGSDSKKLKFTDQYEQLTEQLHYLQRGAQLAAARCVSEIGVIMSKHCLSSKPITLR